MYFLKCNNCGHFNEVKTEYLVFCSKCYKKLYNNYSSWIARNPDKTFQDFKQTVCTTSIEEPLQISTNPRTRQLKLWIGIMAIAAMLCIIGLIANSPLINVLKQTDYQKALVLEAEEINASCPVMVDQDTRLDKTMALVNNTFQYCYTLVNIDKKLTDIDEIKKDLEPAVIDYVRINPDMEALRENQTAVSFFYRDKNGAYLFTILVSPEQYK